MRPPPRAKAGSIEPATSDALSMSTDDNRDTNDQRLGLSSVNRMMSTGKPGCRSRSGKPKRGGAAEVTNEVE
jgi:hypothetical protein